MAGEEGEEDEDVPGGTQLRGETVRCFIGGTESCRQEIMSCSYKKNINVKKFGF